MNFSFGSLLLRILSSAQHKELFLTFVRLWRMTKSRLRNIVLTEMLNLRPRILHLVSLHLWPRQPPSFNCYFTALIFYTPFLKSFFFFLYDASHSIISSFFNHYKLRVFKSRPGVGNLRPAGYNRPMRLS